MTWFKVDDTFAFHRKAVAAGNAALGLWVRAGSWCSQQLTDGFVPDHMVISLGTKGQAKRLVDVGLWERVDGGYRFWQWNEPGRQPTREQVEGERAAARDRMRRIRNRSPERSPEHVANGAGTSGAVRDARPVPSRPDDSESSVSDQPSVVDARSADEDARIDKRIIEVIYERTGRYVPPEHAAAVRHELLDDRDIRNPLTYVAAAIRGEPAKWLPTTGHPSNRSVNDAIAESLGRRP